MNGSEDVAKSTATQFHHLIAKGIRSERDRKKNTIQSDLNLRSSKRLSSSYRIILSKTR